MPIRKLIFTLAGCGLCLPASTAAIAAAQRPAASAPLATGSFATAAGTAAGTAIVVAPEGGNSVLRVTVSGLPAGPHGVHIHTTGKCDAPGFTTAGGHLNPTGHQHGKNNPAGSHLGDLPNISVDGHGNGELVQTLKIDAEALRAQLFDADGAAVVVHADPDDYRTDPSGNSGARIACAVLRRG